jgi:hypothetical protein
VKYITTIIMLAIAAAASADFIPVTSWPSKISIGNKVCFNPTPELCVQAGYRLLQPAEKTPGGKRIASEQIIQDSNDAMKAIIVRTYEDIPAPPVIQPPKTTNVPASKVTFTFTTNGAFIGATWIDAPKTNGVKE